MKPTILQGYKVGQGEAENERFFLQLRGALNGSIRRAPQAITTAGTSVSGTIFTTDSFDYSSCALIEVAVHGLSSTGAAYLYGRYAGMFRRDSAGAMSQIGTTRTIYQEVSAGQTAVFSLGTDNVAILVNDNSAAAMTWWCWVELFTG